jgi:hypothetical protein
MDYRPKSPVFFIDSRVLATVALRSVKHSTVKLGHATPQGKRIAEMTVRPLLFAILVAWSTTLSVGEDPDRLDLEASYCEGVLFRFIRDWESRTNDPSRAKTLADLRTKARRVVSYLWARGNGHDHVGAIANGIEDSNACIAACTGGALASCLDTWDSPQCKKVSACFAINERLPM